MKYYLLDNKKNRKGPYKESQLSELWNTGKIPSGTLCCSSGGKEWAPIENFMVSGDASIADELRKLQQLHKSGVINASEFASAKDKLLNSASSSSGNILVSEGVRSAPEALQDQETKQWGMLLHFSICCGYLIPLAGLAVPIIIWQVKKNELPGLDEHGKNVLNWIISVIIYGAICTILVLLVIGVLLLYIMGIIGIILPVIAGIKASNGEAWEYPLAIKFLK